MDMHHDDRARGDDHDHDHTTASAMSHVRVARRPSLRPVAAPSGAGWYHDAAIESARESAIEYRCNPYGADRG